MKSKNKTFLQKANEAFFKKNYNDAVVLYKAAIKENPYLNEFISFNLGLSLKKISSGNAGIEVELELPYIFSEYEEVPPHILDLLYEDKVIYNNKEVEYSDVISVIIPSFNNSKWLKRAMNSVLSQQGVNFELLVVDDGSTDNSVNIAREVAANHANVRVISLLRNFGCYYARNVGVYNAIGDYFCIVDSDDIISPERLIKQLRALKKNPLAVACRTYQRRWENNFLNPLSDIKAGESSLLWSRDVFQKIGYFDSVKFGGDTEFRYRIQRAYGVDSVVVLSDELYFARTVESSLTMSSAGKLFTIEDGRINFQTSTIRSKYQDNFNLWQKRNKSKEGGLYISRNLQVRPFPLGAEEQNASLSLGQKIIGAMASFPPREKNLKEAISSILPQIDELILYLNNYKKIPDFAINEKIKIIRSEEAKGDLRDNGKFYNLPQDENTYIFTLDDDLIYPEDYVDRMIHYIESLNRSSVVGLHGVIFPEGNFNKLQQRKVYHFAKKSSGNFVDLLGTGTAAWHSSTLKIGLDSFLTKGVCDLWFSATAAKSNVPLFSIPRENKWLKSQETTEESLFNEALRVPDIYFETYNKYISPALRNGLIRKNMEAHISYGFDSDTILASGISMIHEVPIKPNILNFSSRNFTIDENKNKNKNNLNSLHFHIIVNGWNCKNYVHSCLRSIANQLPGPYTYQVTIIDDGSNDGTYQEISNSVLLPKADFIRIPENMGPAYARHIGISAIKDPETIVVLVDLDDALEPQALKVVADRYLNNKKCLLTIGNWHDQYGKINPQGFYSEEEINEQNVRKIEIFNATALRTFRRKLYDAVLEEDLHDMNGKWLETCTDVALMFPLLDQCWAHEVEFIAEPIYKYTRQHGNGTLKRFGKPHKVERLAWLKSKPVKVRFNR